MSYSVSIIINCYNGKIFRGMLKSLQNQIFQDFEVILITSSGDKSAEIFKHESKKFRYFKSKNF